MQHYRKPIALLLTVCTIAVCLSFLVACSSGNDASPSGLPSSTNPKTSVAKDAIKVDQIEWEASNAVENGFRRIDFIYSNGSNYPISEFEMDFTLKKDVTFDELKSAFTNPSTTNEYLTSIVEKLTEEDYSQATITVTNQFVTGSGSDSEPEYITAGITYLTSMDQFDLFEPNMMIVSYVDGNKIYKETYDYATASYSVSKDTTDIIEWPDSELTQMLPQPEDMLIVKVEEKDGGFKFETVGTSKAVFDEYVSACKAAGFTINADESDYLDMYKAENDDSTYKLDIDLMTWGELECSLTPTTPISTE